MHCDFTQAHELHEPKAELSQKENALAPGRKPTRGQAF